MKMWLPQGAAKSRKKDAEHPPSPLCRSHLLCPHSPSSRILLAQVFSSPFQCWMWKPKVSPSFQRPLHLSDTTGKYQDLGKTLSKWIFPSTLSYNTLKVRWDFLSSLLACFLLPVSGNWDVTGPFVTDGPLHLSVLPWLFCCSLGNVLCVWKALYAYNPWKSHWVALPVTQIHQYIAIFGDFCHLWQHHDSLMCGKNNPGPPLAMQGWIWVMQMTAMQRLGTSFCSLLPQASFTTLLSVQNTLQAKSWVLFRIFTSGYSSGKAHTMLLELKYYCKCF